MGPPRGPRRRERSLQGEEREMEKTIKFVPAAFQSAMPPLKYLLHLSIGHSIVVVFQVLKNGLMNYLNCEPTSKL